MEQSDFDEWLESSVTQYFRKYLTDAAVEESAIVADTILAGAIISTEEQIRIATMSLMFNRIATMEFEEIESFYKK